MRDLGGPNPLSRYLNDLRVGLAYPSVREITGMAADRGFKVSHTSVHDVLSGHIPAWATARKIVVALGGDETKAFDLWQAEITERGKPYTVPRTESEYERLIVAIADPRTAIEALTCKLSKP